MAILYGRSFRGKVMYFSLTPLPYSSDNPNSYEIRYGTTHDNKDIVLRRNVHGWQFGHSHIERLAEAFANVQVLRSFRGFKSVTPALCDGLDWLNVVLLDSSSKRFPDGVTLHLYIAEPQHEMDIENTEHPEDTVYIRFGFSTDAESVCKFGQELIIETNQAREERMRLGVATEEDIFFNYD
ncbi:hypothetical protein LBMAG21_00450 [Armatimonadota bacterium]|nr:hypothetical protein LBMAG21_00450 [Armatimonadota bacterium]